MKKQLAAIDGRKEVLPKAMEPAGMQMAQSGETPE
jgi:hypothetical protein